MAFRQQCPQSPGHVLSRVQSPCMSAELGHKHRGYSVSWPWASLSPGTEPCQELRCGLSLLPDASCSIQRAAGKGAGCVWKSCSHCSADVPWGEQWLGWAMSVIGSKFYKNLGVIKKSPQPPPPTFSKEMVWCITAHCHSLWIPDSSRLWGFSAWLGELFIIIYFSVCWVELSGVSGTSGQWVLMES